MTPEEKALELLNKYYNLFNKDIDDIRVFFDECKQCALIAVDELIYYLPSVDIYPYFAQKLSPGVKEYWNEVKQEIEKL